MEGPLGEAGFAVAFAGSAALASTLPLAGARHVPGLARAALALSITPLAAHGLGGETIGDAGVHACLAAVGGASAGMAASILAGAVVSAAALIDQALTAGPGLGVDVSGQGAGPFSVLLPLLFANVLCQSGAFGWLLAAYAAHSATVKILVSHVFVAGLARTALQAALTLALLPLCAHALATLLAGIAARVAPRVNGLLLAPALGSPMSLLVVLASVPATFAVLKRIADEAARAALSS
jgi:flagellar biosynthesis protein FliR